MQLHEPLQPTQVFMKRIFVTLYEYFALYFGLISLGIICLVWLPIAIILQFTLPSYYGGLAGRLVIRYGFHVYLSTLSLIGACRFDLSALDTLKNEPAMIIAPNHPCLLDAILVISRFTNVICIMKAELINNIFLGAGARLAGYIRNDNKVRMVKTAVQTLHQGNHILIFPEGTRTRRLPVNPFMGSAGLIARHAKVPVQTVFIETDSAYLSKGWPLFRKPSLPITYHVKLGKRFQPTDNVKSFNANMEQYFMDELSANAPMPESPAA